MNVKNENILDDLDGVNMTSTILSTPQSLIQTVNFSVQVVWTGTITGTLKLEGSNDLGTTDGSRVNDVTSLTNWSDIPNQTEAVSGAGSRLFNIENCGYRWYRLSWTFATNTGTITVARSNVKNI